MTVGRHKNIFNTIGEITYIFYPTFSVRTLRHIAVSKKSCITSKRTLFEQIRP